MARARFQQKCAMCKKSWVQMFSTRQFPICASCQMKRLGGPIDNPKYKKLLEIPTELYEQSYFLRSIREKYQHFGSLTDKQKETFQKVVKEMSAEKAKKVVEETKEIIVEKTIVEKGKKKAKKRIV